MIKNTKKNTFLLILMDIGSNLGNQTDAWPNIENSTYSLKMKKKKREIMTLDQPPKKKIKIIANVNSPSFRVVSRHTWCPLIIPLILCA